LVRDEATGDSKGFAFLKYEDARSCVLAVDNLCGTKVGGWFIASLEDFLLLIRLNAIFLCVVSYRCWNGP